jgi:hypothetical protein
MAKRRNYPVRISSGSILIYINDKESVRKSYRQIFDKIIGGV